MALPIQNLKQSNDPVDLFIPEVVAQPHINVWSVVINPFLDEALIAEIQELLPHYWAAPGIVDCKLMLAKGRSSCVVIESWEKAEHESAFRETKAWQCFLDNSETQLMNLVNNTFELIE